MFGVWLSVTGSSGPRIAAAYPGIPEFRELAGPWHPQATGDSKPKDRASLIRRRG